MSDDSMLLVYLGDRLMGELRRLKGGKLQFIYNDDYRNEEARVPFSLSMPLLEKNYGHETVNPFLWGLLPDNEWVLQRWAIRFGVSPSNCFGLLSGIGEDCAGAIRFVTEPSMVAKGGKNLLKPDAIEQRLAELRRDPSLGRVSSDRGQFSLAGAQAKTALQKRGNSWYLPWGNEPTTHILKTPRPDLDGHVENEHFCLCLARALGLNAAKSEVVHFGNEIAICVERYDRVKVDGRWVRVHQEDVCQALAVHPARKYENDGGPGVIDSMQLLNRSSRANDDRRRLMEAIVFNYLILGSDAHAKNYGLLLGLRGQVRLAPLYDLASALPYVNRRRDERLAMKIGPYYQDSRIRPRHFEAMARRCDFPWPVLKDMMIGMAEEMTKTAERVFESELMQDVRHPVLETLVEKLITRTQRILKEWR